MTSRQARRIAEPLNVSHWPPATECPVCKLTAAYRFSDRTICASLMCDPAGHTWLALDRHFRRFPCPIVSPNDLPYACRLV